MAYKEFQKLVDLAAGSIRTDERIVKKGYEWDFDSASYYTQQIFIFLSDRRKEGLDLNRIFEQRIKVKYEKGRNCIKNFKKDESISMTQENQNNKIAKT